MSDSHCSVAECDMYSKVAMHSRYIRTVSSYRLLSTLLNWFELVYMGFFGRAKLNFCQMQMYQS
jgi:hypothetical protein